MSSGFHYLAGIPYTGVYAGSKTFNLFLHEGYWSETLDQSKIDFQCLMPAFVESNMTTRVRIPGKITAK